MDLNLPQRLKKWEALGLRVMEDGAVLYGEPIPEPGRGFLHQVMPSHDEDVLDEFFAERGYLARYQHPKIWRYINGCKLFFDALYILGPDLRSKTPRISRAYDVMSVNLGQPEILERFPGEIFAGSMSDTSAWYYVELAQGNIVAVDRETFEERGRWTDLDRFLTLELDRLNRIWPADGTPPESFPDIPFDT